MAFPLSETDAGSRPIVVCMRYAAPAAAELYFVAPFACRVRSITHRVLAAGTDGGAVTGAVTKAASATALGSGVSLQASTTDLKATANTNTTVGLSTTATDLDIAAGTTIGLLTTGTTTAATGCFTVVLDPM